MADTPASLPLIISGSPSVNHAVAESPPRNGSGSTAITGRVTASERLPSVVAATATAATTDQRGHAHPDDARAGPTHRQAR